MQEVRDALAPLTDWLPPGVRGLVDVEVWWLILLTAALLALLLLGYLVRAAWRSAFARRRPKVDWDKLLREDLEACPVPPPPGERVLTVYHVPARLRLVVLAAGGKEVELEAGAARGLLERLVPGLAAVAAHDGPLVRVWPSQLSQAGFTNAFHRRTVKPEPDGEPSRWVLVAGRVALPGPPLMLGLGLWADEPTTLGRLNLEPHQWRDVLRLQAAR